MIKLEGRMQTKHIKKYLNTKHKWQLNLELLAYTPHNLGSCRR